MMIFALKNYACKGRKVRGYVGNLSLPKQLTFL